MKRKKCVACGKLKHVDQFHTRSRAVDGLAYYCKACTSERAKDYNARNAERHREKVRQWRLANPEKAKATHAAWIANNKERYREACKFRRLRTRYGISRVQYENLLSESGGKCQLCGDTAHLCVDHCHESRVVRGVLCVLCNTAIERLESVPDFIEKAVAYLRKHSGG